MSDAYDDFQIKPLTKGLGFHKKAISLSDEVSRSGMSQENSHKPIPGAPPDEFFDDLSTGEKRPTTSKAKEALDKLMSGLNQSSNDATKAAASLDRDFENQVEITNPLPRAPESDIFSIGSKGGSATASMNTNSEPMVTPEPSIPTPMPDVDPEPERKAPSRPVVTGTLPIPPSAKVREQVGTRRSAHDSPVGPLVPGSISLPSIVLDFVVVVALSLVFLVSLLSVTKVEVLSVAFNAQSDLATQLSLAILFVAIMQMYVVVARSFFGRTLGEWTFDFQMGDDRQHKSGFYPLLVAWRSLLVVLTGVVTLPLLSLIMRKDITAKISGLQLYRRKN